MTVYVGLFLRLVWVLTMIAPVTCFTVVTEVTLVNQIKEEGKRDRKPGSRSIQAKVEKYLPEDLLTEVTVLSQDSGYVTISPKELSKPDWRRVNESVKQMGGIWISNNRFSHWSIPFSRKRIQFDGLLTS